jgi:hypothetical protein
MYDFLGGRVGVLFFVGAAWLAGLVRFAGGRLVAFARLPTFRVFFFIVGVLEMPKGPERTPCATVVEMYCGQSGSSETSKEIARGSIRTFFQTRKATKPFCIYIKNLYIHRQEISILTITTNVGLYTLIFEGRYPSVVVVLLQAVLPA